LRQDAPGIDCYAGGHPELHAVANASLAKRAAQEILEESPGKTRSKRQKQFSFFMPIFTLYCDDSGTHAASDVAIAACYIATVEQWGELKRNWDEINVKENFGRFHMAWLISLPGRGSLPRQNGRTTKKRTRTISKFVSVITTRMTLGVTVAVIKSAYDEVVPARNASTTRLHRLPFPDSCRVRT
jgi:hypothetical protein